MSDLERALELRDQALAYPEHSPERVDLLEAALRHADSASDQRLSYDIRTDLIDAAMFAGEPLRALVAFAWCLALSDERPDEFPEDDLHWRYKWIAGRGYEFVEIPREQCLALVDDLAARFAKYGLGQGMVWKLRAGMAEQLGVDGELEPLLERWRSSERDALSDCQACDLSEEVRLLTCLGRDEEAVEAIEQLLARRLRCAEVPAITYAVVMPALLRRRDLERAQHYHRKGYPLLRRLHKEGVGPMGEHLLFCTVTNQLGRGLRILRESLSFCADHSSAQSRLEYLSAAHVLTERIGRSQPEITITLPTAFGGSGEQRAVDCRALAERFEAEARALARRFDQRNESARRTRWLEERFALRDLELELP